MEDAGQNSINIKASGKSAVARADKRLVCKSYTDSDNVKLEEQATLSGMFSENDFDL